MASLKKLYPQLVNALELEARKDGAVGRRGGFPVGLQMVDPNGKGMVLLHTRFPKLSETPIRSQFVFDHTLQRLVDEKLAEVSIEKDIAYLSLRKATDRIEKQEAVAAVDEFIAGLQRAGLSAGETCHYCGSTEEVQTAFNGHRVGQICGGCTRQQAIALMNERDFDHKSVSKLAVTSALVVPMIALAWAALWVGIFVLFARQGGTLNVNVKLGVLGAIFAGIATATPALLFRRVRNRGDVGAGLLGLVCAILAVALGELASSTFQVWWTFGQVNVQAGAIVAVSLFAAGNGMFLLLRGAALVALVSAAFRYARPPAAKLAL
jgi:hypothetical protein